MVKYICLAPSKEQFNVNGESLGMSGERALYYAKSVGKHRIYRSMYPLEPYMFKGKNTVSYTHLTLPTKLEV